MQYEGDVSARVASLEAKKTLLQLVVSEEGAKFAAMDIKDFYISKNHQLKKPVYIKIQ